MKMEQMNQTNTEQTLVVGTITAEHIKADWHAMGLLRNKGEDLQSFLGRLIAFEVRWCYDRISENGEMRECDSHHIAGSVLYYIDLFKE